MLCGEEHTEQERTRAAFPQSGVKQEPPPNQGHPTAPSSLLGHITGPWLGSVIPQAFSSLEDPVICHSTCGQLPEPVRGTGRESAGLGQGRSPEQRSGARGKGGRERNALTYR